MTLPSMKKFLCKGIVSVTLACAAVPTATHADDLRQTILINDGWTFAFADDTAHVAVSLPHTWNADACSTRDYPIGIKDVVKFGDFPVVWTNTRYRMIYLNMGHGDLEFTDATQNLLFVNALRWVVSRSPKGDPFTL